MGIPWEAKRGFLEEGGDDSLIREVEILEEGGGDSLGREARIP